MARRQSFYAVDLYRHYSARYPVQEQPVNPVIAAVREQRINTMLDFARYSDPNASLLTRLSRQTGAPPVQIEGRESDIQRSQQVEAFGRLLRQLPELVDFFGDRQREIASAYSDHRSLGILGSTWDTLKKIPSAIGAGFVGLGGAGARINYWLMGGLGEAGDWLADVASPGRRTVAEKATADAAREAYWKRGIENADADTASVRPIYTGPVQQGLLQGLESLPTSITAMVAGAVTRSPGVAAGIMGGYVGLPAYTDARLAGRDIPTSIRYAMVQGGSEAVFELAPANVLLAALAGRKGVAATVGKYLATELPSEMATTYVQSLSDWQTLHPETSVTDWLASLPEAEAQTILGVLSAGPFQAGAMRAGLAVTDRLAQYQVSRAHGVAIERLSRAAEQSAMRKDDPEAFAALVQHLGAAAGSASAYVPGDVVQAYMQSEGYDPFNDPFEEYRDQVEEAVATGGDVVLPTGFVLGTLPGTSAWDAIKDEVRLAPDSMSKAEALAFETEYADFVQQQIEAATQTETDRVASLAPVTRVYEDVLSQARQAGFNLRSAQAYAETWASRYEARAARNPALGTAWDAYQASNVSIVQELPAALSAYRKADNLDVVINAMKRAKDGKKDGRESLLEWVARRGGIEDKGGNIAAMGGNKWHREKRFRKKLLKPYVEAQGNLIGSSGANPNSIENTFDAAISAGFFPDLLAQREGAETYADALDVNTFLDAIASELRGSPIYAEELQQGAGEQAVGEAADELRRILSEQGVDPDKATRAQVDAALKAYADERDDFARSYSQGERGRIDIMADGHKIIRLFESRDLSTLLHESGHLWLEELRADARDPDASDQVRADWQTVAAWFADQGVALGDDGSIPVDAHELFARGIERFFMEGKAPSLELRSAFATFRAWLLRIYQLVANLRSPITPEIRDVFNRLLATDEAISDAQSVMDSKPMAQADLAMTDAEYAAYSETVGNVRTEAFDALLYRTMENVRRSRTLEWKRERAGVREGVVADISARPEFRALAILRSRGPDRVALSRSAIVEALGEDALKMIPKGVPPTVVERGGVKPSILAETVGLRSGDELLERLMGIQMREDELRANGDKRSALDEAVDLETDRIMRERHGDVLTDGSIEEEALSVIHSDTRATVLASELRALGRRSNNVPTPLRLAREWAERTVREGRIADNATGSALARHKRAELKAQREAEKAILAGDLEEAFNQKQAQMLNHALWRATKDAKDEIDKIVRRLGKLAKAKTLKSMDQDYLDRIHDLLADYDFRHRTQRDLAERVDFLTWVAQREAAGEEVHVPPRLADAKAMNWSQMTFGDLTALDDVIASIAHLGRRKKKLLVAQEERDFDELVHEAIEGAAAVPDLPATNERNPAPKKLARVAAELVKVESIADDMDDHNPNGVFNKLLIRGATAAANKKAELTDSVLKPLAELYLRMSKEQRARLQERVDVPEFVNPDTGEPTNFSRMELVAVALNTGNESNLDKMLRGEDWTLDQVEAVLARELQAEDWQFVQAVWNQIDSLWPEIAKVERELTGVVPEKVEPRTVQTPFGPLAGGYYPLVYDPNHPRASSRTRDNAADDAERFFGQHGRSVSTPKGHTIERTDFAGPLLYSVEGVLFNHVNRVTTRIAYGRYIRDALKFTRDRRIRDLMRKKLGVELRDQVEPWLRRQVNEAAMNTRDLRGAEQVMRTFRINATLVGMGFRATTMMAQVSGLNNSAGLIGGKWVATGMAEWLSKRGEAKAMVFEVSPELARRAQEFDRDINAAFAQMTGKASRLDVARSMAFWGIGFIDVHMVAIPTWLGAYRKALSEGMSEEDAVAYGDKIVRVSQGSGRAKDLSALQDSNEGFRVLTMFYSYFNALYQQQRMAVRAAKRGDFRKAGQITFYAMIAAPLMSALLTGDWPDEEEDWFEWAAARVFFGLWAGIPLVRDFANSAQQAVTGKARNLQDAVERIDQPAVRAMVSLAGLMDGFYKGATEGELPERWLKNAIETPGYFLGLPTGQVGASVDYLYGVASGEQHPEDIGDVGYGLVKGRQQDQK